MPTSNTGFSVGRPRVCGYLNRTHSKISQKSQTASLVNTTRGGRRAWTCSPIFSSSQRRFEPNTKNASRSAPPKIRRNTVDMSCTASPINRPSSTAAVGKSMSNTYRDQCIPLERYSCAYRSWLDTSRHSAKTAEKLSTLFFLFICIPVYIYIFVQPVEMHIIVVLFGNCPDRHAKLSGFENPQFRVSEVDKWSRGTVDKR